MQRIFELVKGSKTIMDKSNRRQNINGMITDPILIRMIEIQKFGIKISRADLGSGGTKFAAPFNKIKRILRALTEKNW